jgi:hypothetical protein
MDIHKPKPWHGVREFLKEYLIIVVGVLTALAGEQAVEAIHRHEEVAKAREALKLEVRRDLTNAVMNGREDRCLGQVLLLWEAYATGGPKPPMLKGAYNGLSSTTWDIVKTTAVPNMPLDERVTFANFYTTVQGQMTLIDVERDFARRLAGYARLPKLSPQEADDLLLELPGMEGMLRSKVINYDEMIRLGRLLGEAPGERKDIFAGRVDKLCALAATVKDAATP